MAKYMKTQQAMVVKTYCYGVNPGKLWRQMESVMKACSLCHVIGVSVDEKGRVLTMLELMACDLRNFIDHKDLL